MKKRAAIYARVSTGDQHLETQLLDLREMAKQRGYEIDGSMERAQSIAPNFTSSRKRD